MPVIDDRTANRNYQKPNALNKLIDDVARLRSQADALDGDIAAALVAIAARAMATHAHAIADVTGLEAALAAKVSASLFSSLGNSLIAANDAAAVMTLLGLGNVATKNLNGDATDVFKGNGTWGKIVAAMIGDGEVTNAKLAYTASTLKGALASGGLADLTPAQVKSLLAIVIADITNAGATGKSLLAAADAAAATALLSAFGGDTPENPGGDKGLVPAPGSSAALYGKVLGASGVFDWATVRSTRMTWGSASNSATITLTWTDYCGLIIVHILNLTPASSALLQLAIADESGVFTAYQSISIGNYTGGSSFDIAIIGSRCGSLGGSCDFHVISGAVNGQMVTFAKGWGLRVESLRFRMSTGNITSGAFVANGIR